MKAKRNPWILTLILIAGGITGSVIGEVLKDNSVFFWLNYGVFPDFGFKFDINFFRLAVDGAMRVNVGCLIGFAVSIFLYIKML